MRRNISRNWGERGTEIPSFLTKSNKFPHEFFGILYWDPHSFETRPNAISSFKRLLSSNECTCGGHGHHLFVCVTGVLVTMMQCDVRTLNSAATSRAEKSDLENSLLTCCRVQITPYVTVSLESIYSYSTHCPVFFCFYTGMKTDEMESKLQKLRGSWVLI